MKTAGLQAAVAVAEAASLVVRLALATEGVEIYLTNGSAQMVAICHWSDLANNEDDYLAEQVKMLVEAAKAERHFAVRQSSGVQMMTPERRLP